MASSAGKRTSEKVSDEHSQIERSVDSKEFDETETVDETRRVDKAEESAREREQLREMFESVRGWRKEMAILMRENEQLRKVAALAATGSQGRKALARGSSYEEENLARVVEATTEKNLPAGNGYEELPKVDVIEDVEMARVVPNKGKQQDKEVESSTRAIEMADKKKGQLKVSAMPVLEQPANKHFDNFSFRFTSALGAIEGDWQEVLLSASGTEADQQRLFSALTCVLKDDVALNLVRRHQLSGSKIKATDAWRTLVKTYAGNTPHRIQLLMTLMHQVQGAIESMEQYTTRVVNAASQLAAIGQPQSDAIVCHRILMGVRRPDYEHAVHQLLHDERMLQSLSATVDYLVIAGARVEEQAAAKKAEQGVFFTRVRNTHAFTANVDIEKAQPQKDADIEDTAKLRDDSNIVCYVCGEMGHRARKCPERHIGKAVEEPSALMAGGLYERGYTEKDSDKTSKYGFAF